MADEPSAETPLRRSAAGGDGSLAVLRRPDWTYADGAEERLADLVARAEDLSSLSTELALAADNWPEMYSLSRSRANVLRALDLDRSMRVLEVGCGCGPVTRYLGETCGQVDAVEPMPARAEVARLRTRDQQNVRVFVGTVDDVPPIPAYDLVIVVGVLEYVAGGAASGAYAAFLSGLSERLVDGGHLVVAIENALGVKYLAGAPEDHSGRPFQSVEGYRQPGPARTFGRAGLERLLAEAGFENVQMLGAFPDYKITRAVFADQLYDLAPQLAYEIPAWPSPVWMGTHARAAGERALWMTLVSEGLAAHCANSHVAVVRKGRGKPTLWRDGRLATFFATERARPFAVQTSVERRGTAISLPRKRLSAGEAETGRVALDAVQHVVTDEAPLYEGVNLVTVLESAEQAEIIRLMQRWAELVRRAPGDSDGGTRSLDLIPQNLLLDSDDAFQVIDDEWHAIASTADVLARGALVTARLLSLRCSPERLPASTIGDVASWLGRIVGLDDGWLQRAVRKEAQFQAVVVYGLPAEDPRASAWAEAYAERLLADLDTPLRQLPMGDRDGDLLRAAEATVAEVRQELAETNARHASELATLRQALSQAEAALAEARADAAGAHARIGELLGSRSWRVTAPVRRAGSVVAGVRERVRRR